MSHRRKGFTLIELLVVISIIALLISILLPALRRSREIAVGIECASRMRSVGMMTLMYVGDNDGKLPTNMRYLSPATGTEIDMYWFTLLKHYYQKMGISRQAYKGELLVRCPTQEHWALEMGGTLSVGLRAMYGYNSFFMGWPGVTESGWRQLTDIYQPSDLPLYGDCNGEEYGGKIGGCAMGVIGGGGYTAYPHPIAYRYGWASARIGTAHNVWGAAANHNGSINYAAADGHIINDGLWPWGTEANPPPAFPYYSNFFHPKRNVNILPTIP